MIARCGQTSNQIILIMLFRTMITITKNVFVEFSYYKYILPDHVTSTFWLMYICKVVTSAVTSYTAHEPTFWSIFLIFCIHIFTVLVYFISTQFTFYPLISTHMRNMAKTCFSRPRSQGAFSFR